MPTTSYSASAHRQVRYGPSFVPELARVVDQDELLLRRRQQVRKQILLVSLLLFLSRRPDRTGSDMVPVPGGEPRLQEPPEDLQGEEEPVVAREQGKLASCA